MPAPTLAPTVDEPVDDVDDDMGVTHITCCHEDDPGDVALCGETLVDLPWMPRNREHCTCVVCDDLAETTDLCPIYGRCDRLPL